MIHRQLLPAAVFAVCAFAGSDAWAITKTWLGGNGNNAQRSDWGRAANWSGGTVPAAADLVVIPTNPVGNPTPGFFPILSGATSIAQLQVQAGATLTLNATLTLSNTTVSPMIDGTGTIAGAGLLQVTNGPTNGILINDSITMGPFTLNAPVGRNMTVTAGKTVTFNGAVNLTQSEMLVGAAAGASNVLDINGPLTLGATATLDLRSPASTLKLSSNLTFNGTWVPGTSTFLIDTTANMTMTLANANYAFYNLTIQTDAGGGQVNADIVTPNSGFTVLHDLTLTRGQFQIGNFTVTVNGAVASGLDTESQLDFTSTGVLECRGNVDLGSLSQVTSGAQGPFATILLDGNAPQTFQIRAAASSQYFDLDALIVNNPAGVTVLDNPNADFTVNGQLNIQAGTLTVQDVFDPEGALVMAANTVLRLENIIKPSSTILGSTFTAGANSTVVYAGPAINQIVYTQQNNGTQIQYVNLTIDNSGGAVATQQNVNTLHVGGNFTIQGAASVFTSAAGGMTVGQSFVDNGTFNHANATVTMTGTGSISGTAALLTFFNLTVDGATNSVVTAARSFTTANNFLGNQGSLTTAGAAAAVTLTAQLGMTVGNGAGAAGTASFNLRGNDSLLIAPTRTFSVNGTDGRFTSLGFGPPFDNSPARNPTLTCSAAGTFVATVAGQANLYGLNFGQADLNGLNFTASATIERLRNVRFSNVAAGASARHLTITSPGLDLDCPGCYFSAVAANQFNVWAVDSAPGGTPVRLRFEERSNAVGNTIIGGPGAGEGFDGDDDTNNDGVINGAETTALHGGAIVQWVYTANIDITGALQGFPEPAFDWNTFGFYSAYGVTSAGIYVLDQNGDVVSQWPPVPDAGQGNVVGPVYWDTEGTSHVVYFGTSTGRVYKLIDTGGVLSAAPAPWDTYYANAASLAAVTSPIIADRTNLYFGGIVAGSNGIYKIQISTKTEPNAAFRTNSRAVTTAPSWVNTPGGRMLYFASNAVANVSNIYRFSSTTWTIDATFTDTTLANPNSDCTTSFLAPTYVPTNILYVGESNGWMHALPATGTAAQFLVPLAGFPFRDNTQPIRGGAVWDIFTNRLFFGNDVGDVYTMGSFGAGWALGTNYFRLSTSGASPIRSSPLYQDGLLYVGNIAGQLLVIDVRTGLAAPNQQAVYRTYNLGSTALGDVSRDFSSLPTPRVYVGTAGGRLYAIPQHGDPTAAFP